MYASLPMYDWPALRATTDELWDRAAQGLRSVGIAAPPALDRGGMLYQSWLRPDLLLSQTCGMPYVRRLRGKVRLVGAMDHGLPGLAAGMYCSRIVARSGDAGPLSSFRGRRVAYNSADSQSGAGALRHVILPMTVGGRYFGAALATGSHAGSIRAVAEDRADVAAVDAVTWELALRHLPEAGGLTVIASTPPTPGLPLITALDGPADALFDALTAALAGMHPDQRAALVLHGVVPRADVDFDIVAEWDAAVVAAGYHELDQGSA